MRSMATFVIAQALAMAVLIFTAATGRALWAPEAVAGPVGAGHSRCPQVRLPLPAYAPDINLTENGWAHLMTSPS